MYGPASTDRQAHLSTAASSSRCLASASCRVRASLSEASRSAAARSLAVRSLSRVFCLSFWRRSRSARSRSAMSSCRRDGHSAEHQWAGTGACRECRLRPVCHQVTAKAGAQQYPSATQIGASLGGGLNQQCTCRGPRQVPACRMSKAGHDVGPQWAPAAAQPWCQQGAIPIV